MRKRFKLVALSLCTLFLSGCGSKGQEKVGKSNDGTVTLSYAIWDSGQEKGLRKLADEFESKNPNTKINIQVIGWNDYWTMLEAFATGDHYQIHFGCTLMKFIVMDQMECYLV